MLSLDPEVPLRETRFSAENGGLEFAAAAGVHGRVLVDAPGFARLDRTWSELPMPEYLPIESLSLYDLTEAYRAFLVRLAQAEPTREVQPEGPPLLERMAMISGVLEQSWYVLFSTLLGTSPPRPEVVVTLLAVLELVRLQRARAQQRELFGDILIERASGEGASRGG